MLLAWLYRVIGYGLVAGAPAYIAAKWGPEVATAVATVGGIILNKVSQEIFPRKKPKD